MIDTFAIYADLRESFGDEPAMKMAGVIGQIYTELSQSVRRDDFNELKSVVADLAEAQKRTEERLDSLTVKVEELAEAQKRTENEVRKLAKGLRETRQMVGGLSDSVGYGLEDRAIAALPALLKLKFDLEPDLPFVRKFININGKDVELNMFGTGRKNNEKWFVVGEGKAKLSRKDVDKFQKLLDRLKVSHIVGERVLPIMVTYSTRPATQDYAESKGMHVIWSYELEQVR